MDEDMDCPHISEAAEKLKLDVEQIKVTLNNRSCNVCLRVDQLWMCLECRQILCGQNAVGHSTAHYEFHKTHCIFINVESAAIFCFKCSSDVEPKNHDDELNRLRQFILYNRGPNANNSNKKRRRKKAPKAVKPKKTSFKRGPKANKKVPNNENDCFINTVTHALCEQEPKDVVPKTDNSNIALKAVVPKKALKAKPKKPFLKRGPRTTKKVGISNSGNNCFMIAVWQSLRHLKPFIYCMKLFKLTEISNKKNNNNSDPRLQDCIAQEMWKLLVTLVDWEKPAGYKFREAISPTALLQIVCKIKPRYKGFHQHDAHEFLMFTLDTLHSELTDEKSKLLLEEEGRTEENPNKIDTLVSLMFRGFLLSEVLCLKCKKPSRKRDPITDISLDVPDFKNADPTKPLPVGLLTDCLERYFEIEELNERNFYFCDKCGSLQKSTKRFWMHALPNILCLHLKRFRWEEKSRSKVHTHIKFPMDSLDMSVYFNAEMRKELVDKDTYMFDLIAVVVHDGEGGGSGHYTSYAVDTKEEQWYEYNDEKVHEVDASLVENVQAYMLFYIKRDMKVNFG